MAVASPPITSTDTRPAVGYMHTHPNCRCVMVPVLKSWTEMGFPSVDALIASGELDRERPDDITGEELLAQLPKATQQRILGKGRWNLWHRAKGRDGIPDNWGFRLSEMIRDSFNEDWGYEYRMRRLDELYAEAALKSERWRDNARRAERLIFPWRFTDRHFDFASNPTPQNKAERDRYRKEAAATPEIGGIVEHWTKITAPDKVEVRLRVPATALPAILRENRVKSQHEVGKSLGLYDPPERRQEEWRQFGYPTTMPVEDRPIFGYLGPIDGKPDPHLVDQYGEVVVRLKPEVRRRTTFSVTDSLYRASIPTPLEQPGPEAFVSIREAGDAKPAHVGAVSQYAEAQIHGRVTTDDIAEVVFTIDLWAPPAQRQPPSQEIIDALAERGIPWRVVDIPRPDPRVLYEAVGPVITPPVVENVVKSEQEERDEDWTPTLGRTRMEVPFVDPFRMRARRNAVVKNHREATMWGDLHGITQREYLRRLDDAVHEALDPSRVEVRVRVPGTVLVEVLDSGRAKSQHETGTSEATLDPRSRKDVEQRTFGYPADTPPDQRPISGYVAPIRSELTSVSGYGGVVLRLENGVRARTTVISTDSLGSGLVPDATAEHTPMPIDEADNAVVSVLSQPADIEHVRAQEGEEGAYRTEELDDETGEYVTVWKKPVRHPRTPEWIANYVEMVRKQEQEYAGSRDHLTALERDGVDAPRYDYWEAQIHGQVRVEDIAEVVFTERLADSTRDLVLDRLDALHIPYRDTTAQPGERGYVVGLYPSNWAAHPSQKRVDGVPMAHVTVTKARPLPAEIEPAPVAEEAALPVEEAAPLVTEEPLPQMGGPVEITRATAAPPAALPMRVNVAPVGKAETAALHVLADRTAVYADPNDTWRREDLTLNYGAAPEHDNWLGTEHVLFVKVGDDGKAVFAYYNDEGILAAVATVTFDENGIIQMVRIRYAQAGEYTRTGQAPSDLFTRTPYQDAAALLRAIDEKYVRAEDLPPGLFSAPAHDSTTRRIWEEAVEIRAEIARILGVKPEDSRWLGAFEGIRPMGRGFFSWEGAIALREDWQTMSIRARYAYLVHELLHSFSPVHSPIDYRAAPGFEEGVVEGLTERIIREVMESQDYSAEGLTDREGYAEYVNPLEEIARDVLAYEDDRDFFAALFKVPLNERQAWIVDQYAKRGRDVAWNTLFIELRRMNIANPMDWGGDTSRSRLTDRQIDVETLEDMARAVFIAGRSLDIPIDWARSERAFYEPLCRATTSAEIGAVLIKRFREIDDLPNGTALLGGLEARNDLFRRVVSGGAAGVLMSRRRDLGVMMEPSRVREMRRWHDEGNRNQTTLGQIAEEAGLPGNAGAGVSRGTMSARAPNGSLVAVRYDTDGMVRSIAYWDGDSVAFYHTLEGGYVEDINALADALVIEEGRATAAITVPEISEWEHDGPADGVGAQSMQDAYERVFTEQERSTLSHIVVHRPDRTGVAAYMTRVAWKTTLGEAVIVASHHSQTGRVIYGFRQGIDPAYIAAHLPDVRRALQEALNGAPVTDVLTLSTQGGVVDMDLAAAQRGEIVTGRDPGMIDALTPEARDWTVSEEEATPEEAQGYAARRSLTPDRPFRWRTQSLLDGAIFYADGSVLARIDLLWRSNMGSPVIEVTPVEGNAPVEYGRLVSARADLVAYLEEHPEFTPAPATTTRTLTRPQANAFPITVDLPADGNVPIRTPVLPPTTRWVDRGRTSEGVIGDWARGQGVALGAPITDPDTLIARFAEPATMSHDRVWVGALHDQNGVAVHVRIIEMPEGWVGSTGETTRVEVTTRIGLSDSVRSAYLTETLIKAGVFLSGAPVETNVPVTYTRVAPDEVFVKMAEGYMGPRLPLINAMSPGSEILTDSGITARPSIQNGIERLDGAHSIAYAYVENGVVRAVLLAASGPGGYIAWTGNEDHDRQTAPYILNYDRTLPRDVLLRITAEMRKAFFTDGHIPQPGDPPRIVVPPGAEAVEAQANWHGIARSDHVANYKSLGLAEHGTPNTFEQGTDALQRNWISLRNQDGRVVAIGYAASALYGAEPGHATVEIVNTVENADRAAIATAIGREMERRGLMWRWRDDDKGRRLAQEARDRATVRNARTDATFPDRTLGWPITPAVATSDGIVLFTTPGGVRGTYSRGYWGTEDAVIFDGVPDPDEGLAAITASREALANWKSLMDSLQPPLSRFMPEHLNEVAFVPVATEEGFTYGERDGARWYSWKLGEQWVTVTTTRNLTQWFAPGDMDRDTAQAMLLRLLPQIGSFVEGEYPNWRVRLQTGPLALSDGTLRVIESTGIMPWDSSDRSFTVREIDDIGATLASLPADVLRNAQHVNETLDWMRASTDAADYVLAQDEWSDDYRWEIRRETHPTDATRTIWYAVVIRKSDSAVMGFIAIPLTGGRARNEAWTVHLPVEEGGVTPVIRAEILERLVHLLGRRPAYMSTLERTFDQVAFTQYDESDEDQRALVERAREAWPRAHRGENFFWLDYDPATSSGNLVLTQEGLMIGVMKVTHAEYTARGTVILTPDSRGRFPDDSLVSDALINSQGQRVEAPAAWTERNPRNRLPLPALVTSTTDAASRVAIEARRFPLQHAPGSVLRAQAGAAHIWQTYDENGHRAVTFRQRITADGTPTGALEVYVAPGYPGDPANLPALWSATYADSPIPVADPQSILNVLWRDPRLTWDGSRVDDPDWLAANGVPNAFGDAADMTDGIYEGGPLPGARVLYEVEHGRIVQALVIPLDAYGKAIPGVLGVRVTQLEVGTWGTFPGGLAVNELRQRAVGKGWITPDTLNTLADWANPDLVANRIVYAQETTDDAQRWDEIIEQQVEADWLNYYGKDVVDQIPREFLAQGMDMDFNSSAMGVVANEFGYEALAGPPDTFRYEKYQGGHEGVLMYYDPTGALAQCVTVALSRGKVTSVHWNRTHVNAQRNGYASRVYHWAITIGTDIEKESGLHGLTTVGGQYYHARIRQPRARFTLAVSRMRPEFGEATTFDEVMEKRDHPVIAEAHKNVVPELEALGVETIPDSAPEFYVIGSTREKRAVPKTTPTLGIFEDSSEPSMRIEIDPARATADDVDLAAAYEVRRQDQDAVVFTAVGFAIKRIPGAVANGHLIRLSGISTSRIRALYSAVAKLTPNASIDDARGVVEFSYLGDAGALPADVKAKWDKLAADFDADMTIDDAHIRWVWYDEATRAAATWMPAGPGVVSLTADEVIEALKGKKDDRADKIPPARDRAAPAGDVSGGNRAKSSQLRPTRRRRKAATPLGDGVGRPDAGADDASRGPDAGPRTRAYNAPTDGRLTAAVPHEPDLAAVRVEAETILRSVVARFGATNLHWSGAVRRNAVPVSDGVAYLDWDGTLVLNPRFDQYNEEGQRGVIAHEMIHAISTANEVDYRADPMFEEGVAEGLATIWRSENGVRAGDAYSGAVDGINMMADLVGMPHEEFYRVLLGTPIGDRPAKVLDLIATRPTHPDQIGPGFTDPARALLYSIAYMDKDISDPYGIVALLDRVQAETGFGPARMRVLMDRLARSPVSDWATIVGNAAQSRGVDIFLWTGGPVMSPVPFTTASVRAYVDPAVIAAGAAVARWAWSQTRKPRARPVARPKPTKTPFLFVNRRKAGRWGIGGNAPPEEPVTYRLYAPLPTPTGAV